MKVTQTKIFSGFNISEVEKTCNKWLLLNKDDYEVQDIKIMLESLTTGDVLYYFTVIYKTEIDALECLTINTESLEKVEDE